MRMLILSKLLTSLNMYVSTFLVFLSLHTFCAAASTLYVANRDSTSVSVIDTATNSVIATVTVQAPPQCLAITSDGTRVYVTCASANPTDGVSVIDTATNSVIATILIPGDVFPQPLVITPDNASVYVENIFADTVSVIDTATNSVIATVAVGSLGTSVQFLAITPDGTRVYVANQLSDNVSVIDTATNSVIATITVGDAPRFLASTPDGARVYVVNRNSSDVSVIDTATNSVATVVVGSFPQSFVSTPDGTRIYVACSGMPSLVSVIDTATNSVIATVVVGSSSQFLTITPDGTRVYVANTDSDNVSVVDTETNSVIATVAVGDLGATGIQFRAITSDNTRVYVANRDSSSVSVIDTTTNSVIATVAVGAFPHFLALPPSPSSSLEVTAAIKNARGFGIRFTYYKLSWNPSPEATSYTIFRNGMFLSQTQSTHYSDIAIDPSQVYTYEVTAYDSTTQIGSGQVQIGPL